MKKLLLLCLMIPSVAMAQFTPQQRQKAISLAPVAKAVLDTELNDYASTRFKEVFAHRTVGDDNKPYYAFCGSLNSKNQFGAYTGWHDFLIMADPADPKVIIRKGGPNDIMGDVVLSACDFNKTDTETIDNVDLSKYLEYK